jgi:hypothetical protein
VRAIITNFEMAFEFNEQARLIHAQSGQCSRNCS